MRASSRVFQSRAQQTMDKTSPKLRNNLQAYYREDKYDIWGGIDAHETKVDNNSKVKTCDTDVKGTQFLNGSTK
jgi:hypothetical protein